MQSRSLSWCVVVLVVGSSTAAFAEAIPTDGEPSGVEQGREVEVGARLIASIDVKLRDVSLSKGARVTVRKVEESRGRAVSADLELADGHVMKRIDMGTIRKSFTVAAD